MFTEDVVREIAAAADRLGLEPAALLAIAEVESGGKPFAVVDGRQEPLIRFEGHYFDRRLGEENRATARAEGLSSPVAGAIANPKTQVARWRMLEKAAAIDTKAAYESVSWGLGQVMGAHWAWLDYANVEALVAEARSGAAGQARLMALYVAKAGLSKALLDHDWETFARGYNGPGYKQYSYDGKIAAAYRRYAAGAIAGSSGASTSNGLLKRGSRGEAVSRLQDALSALGYALDADGVFGPVTMNAVRRFQNDNALAVDGIAGPKTLAALQALAPAVAGPGLWAALVAWLATLFGRG